MDSTFNMISLKQVPLPLTSDQKTFNRLKAKIKSLQEQQKLIIGSLDKGLEFYYEKIKPQEVLLIHVYSERIKIVYQFYKGNNKLSKKDRELLKGWLKTEVNFICGLSDGDEIDPEVKTIFQEFHGIDYEERLALEFDEIKKRMAQSCKDAGIEIDVSSLDIDYTASSQEILDSMYRSIRQAACAGKEGPSEKKERKKTKKQLEKEEKTRLFQEMQNKSVNAIYKHMAKILHPDLEQDNDQKIKKEEFMKRLTCAYEKNDLFGILTLEMEWMNNSTTSDQMQLKNSDQLKIYNGILKEQVKELEATNQMLSHAPQYAPIAHFYNDVLYGQLIIMQEYKRLQSNVHKIQSFVDDLRTDKADKLLHDLIVELRNYPEDFIY